MHLKQGDLSQNTFSLPNLNQWIIFLHGSRSQNILPEMQMGTPSCRSLAMRPRLRLCLEYLRYRRGLS
jgi:hypothetical protein